MSSRPWRKSTEETKRQLGETIDILGEPAAVDNRALVHALAAADVSDTPEIRQLADELRMAATNARPAHEVAPRGGDRSTLMTL